MTEIKLGDVTVTRVEEQHGPIMPAREFSPDLPERAWREHRHELEPDHPADVDLVVHTHLHLDHIGWNTRLVDGTWVPTFPNATHLMPLADFEHWDPARNPAVAGGVNAHAFEDSIQPVLESGQVRLWEDTHRIDANLRLEAAPGHTPGSSVVELASGGDRALFAGDVLHTPLQLAEPGHNSCFCEDPVRARATRQRLLGWAEDEHVLLVPAHFGGHSALEVERRGGAFAVKRWGPVPAAVTRAVRSGSRRRGSARLRGRCLPSCAVKR